MMKKIRANKICRFLKIDLDTLQLLVVHAEIKTTDIRPVTMFSEIETEKIFIAFGKSIYKFFKKTELKINSKENIEYPIKPINKELGNEFRLINSMFYCLKTKQKEFLEISIKDFQINSKYKNCTAFQNFTKAIIDNNDKYTDSFYKLIEFIKDKDDELTDFKNKDVKPEKEFKTESDHTDYEKIIMESFRTGNQDKFGY